MGATWTCHKCGANVLGSHCKCESESDQDLRELRKAASTVFDAFNAFDDAWQTGSDFDGDYYSLRDAIMAMGELLPGGE